ncbi:MAG: YtxH domain-containing protein [Coriobacteriales bacterium]
MGKFRFILGAAAGAAAALLFAPRSGKETRRLLAEKVEDVADAAPEPIRSVAEPVIDAAASAYGKASAHVEQSPAADDIKAKIAEARDALAEQITRNHVSATTVEADVTDVPVDDLIEDAAEEAVEAAESALEDALEEAQEALEEPEAAQPEEQPAQTVNWYK